MDRHQSSGNHRPVLLIGAPRSGTTWTVRVLAKAANAALMNEPDNVHSDPHGKATTSLGFGPYRVLDPGDQAPQYEALWRLAFSGYVPARRGVAQPVARVALRVPAQVRDPLLSLGAGLLARAQPARRVIVKSVLAHFCLEWLAERFQPQVVVMQRDPMNVVSSWLRLQVHGYDLHERPVVRQRFLDPMGIEPPRAGFSQLELCAWWVGLLTEVLREQWLRHPEWTLVTHETVCGDATSEFRALYAKLGLEWTEETTRAISQGGYNSPTFRRTDWSASELTGADVTQAQPNRWRERLSADEAASVNRVLEGFPNRGWLQQPASVA